MSPYGPAGLTMSASAPSASDAAAAAVPSVDSDPWDKALAALADRVAPPPLFIEPPAVSRDVEPVTASGGVEGLLLRLIAAVEAGQQINLDGRVLVADVRLEP